MKIAWDRTVNNLTSNEAAVLITFASFAVIYNPQQHLLWILLSFRIYSLERCALMRQLIWHSSSSNKWTIFGTDDSLLRVAQKSNDVRQLIPYFPEQIFMHLRYFLKINLICWLLLWQYGLLKNSFWCCSVWASSILQLFIANLAKSKTNQLSTVREFQYLCALFCPTRYCGLVCCEMTMIVCF